MFHKDKPSESYLNDEFLPLDELVYAPVRALVNSNRQLQSQIVELLKSTGTIRQDGSEEIIQLDSLNIAYEQVRPEAEDEYSVDNLQLKLPLLSVIPLSNLKIDEAEIDFYVEVRAENDRDGDDVLSARICSPEQRDSDFFPRVHYQLKFASIPAAEGLLRLTDTLGSNPVAKQTDTTPINITGSPGSEEQKTVRMKCLALRHKIQRLKQLYKKVSDMMTEQERMHQISKSAFEDHVYDYDEDKYRMVQGNIANRIMKYQTEIMDLEITYGLEHDYE